ncbi:hypothetical protein KO488_02575 [Poseidonibacter lekithochrous]|uniref:hypothetical protein n=1 Tax=Poseidonibacter TaxID=2321187 RepID=UPI001C07F609|nr:MULTISPECIES: hypothetical protein [Poseidonibacter]MBU3013627.1 hypothetical protein [Poseidonibacter lekithochrous]MDO6826924.1 hypothetical protein [Poseidonibacter sp. 1_MG-2023]
MNIITFCEVDDSLIDSEHKVEHFHSGISEKADIIIINIDSIFEFEENKAEVCNEKYVSVAIIDDEEDYDAFKNFGIDAWIKVSDLSEINGLLNLVEKRFLT